MYAQSDITSDANETDRKSAMLRLQQEIENGIASAEQKGWISEEDAYRILFQ